MQKKKKDSCAEEKHICLLSGDIVNTERPLTLRTSFRYLDNMAGNNAEPKGQSQFAQLNEISSASLTAVSSAFLLLLRKKIA